MRSDLELTGEEVDALISAGFEPTREPQLIELREQSRKMAKGGELTITLAGRVNVKDQALIAPDILTEALFEWLYALHGNDYQRFADSCRAAIRSIKSTDTPKAA